METHFAVPCYICLKEDCDIKSELVDSENITGQVDGNLDNRTLQLTKDAALDLVKAKCFIDYYSYVKIEEHSINE